MPQYTLAQRKQRLPQVLADVNGSPTAAAKALGVSRATIYRWMRELGLRPERRDG